MIDILAGENQFRRNAGNTEETTIRSAGAATVAQQVDESESLLEKRI